MELYIIYVGGSFLLFFLWLLMLKIKDTKEKKNIPPPISQEELNIKLLDLHARMEKYPFNPDDYVKKGINYKFKELGGVYQLKVGEEIIKTWDYLLSKYDNETTQLIIDAKIWQEMTEQELEDMVLLFVSRTNGHMKDTKLYDGSAKISDFYKNNLTIEQSNDKKGNLIRTFVFKSKQAGNYFKFIGGKLDSYKFRDASYFSA